MIRSLLALASSSDSRARLSILIFHRVLPAADPLFPEEIDARRFDEICGWLQRWCNVLPLPDAFARLAAGTLPARACAITFDDGYADNRNVALPILARHGLGATFFIATGFLDGGRMWNDTVIEALRRTTKPQLDLRDVLSAENAEAVLPAASVAERRRAVDWLLPRLKYLPSPERVAATERIAAIAGVRLPDNLMMTSRQVREMHEAGMQIGAHTVSHPILAKLDVESARDEIAASKRFLEDLIGERVGWFAYPNGKPGTDYSAQSVELARAAGFDGAVSTAWGAADRASDRFQIPRFTPWDRTPWRFGLRMARNLMRAAPEPALLEA